MLRCIIGYKHRVLVLNIALGSPQHIARASQRTSHSYCLLADAPEAAAVDRDGLLRRLLGCVRADFTTAGAVQLDGWVLPDTEARLCCSLLCRCAHSCSSRAPLVGNAGHSGACGADCCDSNRGGASSRC